MRDTPFLAFPTVSDYHHAPDPDIDPDRLAKEDPLATQVWRMYAKTKATLPHAQRMENITWRMMALALKKRKEDEESKATEGPAKEEEAPFRDQASGRLREAPQVEHKPDNVGEPDERGRRIDKGKARVRVEGFDGTNQDPFEEEEYVPSLSI